jgi:hypothetical protein
MGVPISEDGYTSATAGRVDYKVHKGHVVALGEGKIVTIYCYNNKNFKNSTETYFRHI